MPKNEPEAARENSSLPTQNARKKQDAQPVVTKIKRKSKKLVKKAIKNAHLYSGAEILYFKMWLALKKQAKTAKINKDK